VVEFRWWSSGGKILHWCSSGVRSDALRCTPVKKLLKKNSLECKKAVAKYFSYKNKNSTIKAI
jgi:hypothetical protein